jgi:peptidoglycan/LPS O-acetylase OafA/YrhL
VWVFFLPGIAAALLRQIAPPFPAAVKCLLALSAALLLLAILALPGYWTPIKLLLVAAMFICLLFCEMRALTVAPLLALGRISFSIYLLQYIVLFNFLQLAYRLPATGSITQTGMLIAVMPTLIVAAMITYRYVERPGMELGTVRTKCLTPTSENQQAGASTIGAPG